MPFLNKEVERLTNLNSNLYDLLRTEKEQAYEKLRNKDAEIRQISTSLRNTEAARDRAIESEINFQANRVFGNNIHMQMITLQEAEIERLQR